jgi:regulator of telomere elongation helicase 1
VIEPRESAHFTAAINDFYQKLKVPGSKGAIFFAVCRGKVSEGLDFADRNGRGVVITGLPYPSLMDPKVCLDPIFFNVDKTNPKSKPFLDSIETKVP